MKRRILSITTALALCLSLCPTWAFAAEADPALCPHHPAHTEECGYAAPTEGQPCGHEHTEDCYTADEAGGEVLDCQHTHDEDCGYVQADPGQPCGYECRVCPIETLIVALPDEVTPENADDVRGRLDEILALFSELTEDEQGQIDLARVYELQGALDGANDPDPVEGEVSVDYQEATWDGSTVTYTPHTGQSCTPVADTTAEWNAGWYAVSGSVTISEPITVTGEVHLILTDGCNLTAEKGIVVTTDNSLTIYAQTNGTGTLTATGTTNSANNASAGIGGSTETLDSGDITIHGGVITAIGGGISQGNSGAGIGGGGGSSGNGGNSGTITIFGGVITSSSDAMDYITEGTYSGGAGIGGGGSSSGNGGTANSITIYGGDVTATSKGTQGGGAGIGGGAGAYTGGSGNITICGGTVRATGGCMDTGLGGAGIGGGGGGMNQQSGNGTVTISDGAVTAVGGTYAAGIGGGSGYKGSYGTNITGGTGNVSITGGIVDAKGGAGNDEGDYAGAPIGNGGNASGTATINKTTGIVFENGAGTVCGNVTFDGSYAVPAGYSLHIPTGASLSGTGTLTGGGEFTTDNITADMISVPEDLVYTGEDLTETIKERTSLSGEVTLCGRTFTASTDGWEQTVRRGNDLTYTVFYNRTDPAGEVRKDVLIAPKSLADASVAITGKYTYTGSPHRPEPFVFIGGTMLAANIDYTVAYANNTNAGTATVTVTGIGNYQGTAEKTFSIEKATLKVTGSCVATGTYGAKLSALTVVGDWTVKSESGAGVPGRWELTGDTVPNVGDSGKYTATFIPTSGAENYHPLTAQVTLNIAKAPLTVTGVTIQTRPYKPTNHAAEVSGVSFTGLVNGDTLALGQDYAAAGSYDDPNAGENKSATILVELKSTAKANNYNLTNSSVNATGTITKADPTVTDVSVSSPATIYESTSLTSITLSHGAGDPAGTVTLDAGQTLTIGTKEYNWTFTPDDANNYNTATGTISLTVAVDTLQSIAVTTPPNKTAYTYGESFDKTGMIVTATYASGATKVVTDEVTISPAAMAVATTALTVNYQGKTASQTITVSPKTVSSPTITLTPSTFEYDGQPKTPAVTVKDGDVVIPSSEYTVAYSNNINVGTATVTITNVEGNYTVSGTANFTITAKPLTGASVSATGPFTYTGSALTPDPIVTLGGQTLVKGTDYTVAYDKNTDAGTATITVTGTGNYSGTASGTFAIAKATLTVDGTGTASGTYGAKLSELTVDGLTAKLGEGTVTGTWKLTGDAIPNVGDSGEYTATFTPDSGAGNYNPLTAQVKLNIAKANYTGMTAASTSGKFGAEKTYDLSNLLPAGYVLGTPTKTDTNSIFEGEPTLSGAVLTYKLADVEMNKGKTGTINVPVTSSTNYEPFNLTITVTVTDKFVPTLAVNPITVTYTGEAVPSTAIKGSATVDGKAVPGTWSFGSGQALTNVADSGTKAVKFVPTDTANYAEATGTVVVTINKATPTGAPKYTTISASGKTLADAGLTTEGSNLKPEGTVAWALADTTEVTANTAYEWIFTPTDTANYTTLTGKITPWVRNTGGGGYVPTGPSTPGSSTLPVTTTGQGSSAVTTTTATPAASTQGGTATTTINTAMGSEIVKQAVANRSETVVIAPKVTGNVTKTEVSIPASTVGQIGSQTNASLTVSTPVADVTIPNGGLGSLSSAGGTVTVTAEQTGNTVELTVTAGGRTVQSVPGGVTLTVPMGNTTPGTVAVLVHENGTREIVRKSVADNGAVTIPLDGSAKLVIVDNSGYFADVPATSWAADAVAFASAHELFNGTAPGRFSPDQPMSRGMLAVVLHNLESNPAQALTGAFADVDNRQWYAEGVSWAAAQGIIGGYGNGNFGPNDNITREQLAVMLWRYAGSPAATERELHFADAYKASDWAQEALRWAVEKGVLNGKGGGILDPGGEATRAETAQMLKNFMEAQ